MKSWAWSFTGCTLLHASLNIWLKLFGLEKSLSLPSKLQTVMTNDVVEWKIRCWCNHTWNTVPCAEFCHYQQAISRPEGTQKKGKRWLKRWRNCLRKTKRAKRHLARLAWKRGKYWKPSLELSTVFRGPLLGRCLRAATFQGQLASRDRVCMDLISQRDQDANRTSQQLCKLISSIVMWERKQT